MQTDLFAEPVVRSTDTRPVLLGMNNPVSTAAHHALYPSPKGCTGWRLWQMSGLSEEDYLSRFDRQNLISGRAWDLREARKIAPGLRESLLGRTVVVLGSPVNSIIRGGTPHELAPVFSWTPDGAGGWIAKVPHPSGLNPFYNDALNRELLRIFMQELAV